MKSYIIFTISIVIFIICLGSMIFYLEMNSYDPASSIRTEIITIDSVTPTEGAISQKRNTITLPEDLMFCSSNGSVYLNYINTEMNKTNTMEILLQLQEGGTYEVTVYDDENFIFNKPNILRINKVINETNQTKMTWADYLEKWSNAKIDHRIL